MAGISDIGCAGALQKRSVCPFLFQFCSPFPCKLPCDESCIYRTYVKVSAYRLEFFGVVEIVVDVGVETVVGEIAVCTATICSFLDGSYDDCPFCLFQNFFLPPSSLGFSGTIGMEF